MAFNMGLACCSMLQWLLTCQHVCRAYPFETAKFTGSKFYGKYNPQDYVCIIPDSVEDPRLYEPERDGVEYAKLIILFKVGLLPKRAPFMGYSQRSKPLNQVVSMAFVHLLDDFAESIHVNNILDPEGV